MIDLIMRTLSSLAINSLGYSIDVNESPVSSASTSRNGMGLRVWQVAVSTLLMAGRVALVLLFYFHTKLFLGVYLFCFSGWIRENG